MTNNMVRWCLTTSAYYNSLEVKEPNFLYFLDDTKEIYRGEIEYTSSVYIVDQLPELAAKGKLYIISTTLEGKIWNGTQWKTVIPAVSSTLTDEDVANGTVTGEAIKAYVGKKISEITQGMVTELSTDKVTLASKIMVKGQTLGSYKDGDEIPIGETLTNILKKQMAKQIPPTYNAPTMSMSPSSQSLESGTNVNPTVTSSYNKRDGGEVTNYKLERIVNGQSTAVINGNSIQPYEQEQIMVQDGGLLKFTASIDYAAGPIKEDNLGDPYPSTSIKAGKLTNTITYTGQRKTFYGKDQQTVAANNSAGVRSLPQNVLNASNGTKLTINIAKGDKRVTFAYPATLRDVSSVLSSALNLNVKDTFVKTLIEVEGANGYNPIQYKVFTYIPAIPFASSDTYTVTI